jgi:hypothetical protein
MPVFSIPQAKPDPANAIIPALGVNPGKSLPETRTGKPAELHFDDCWLWLSIHDQALRRSHPWSHTWSTDHSQSAMVGWSALRNTHDKPFVGEERLEVKQDASLPKIVDRPATAFRVATDSPDI